MNKIWVFAGRMMPGFLSCHADGIINFRGTLKKLLSNALKSILKKDPVREAS